MKKLLFSFAAIALLSSCSFFGEEMNSSGGNNNSTTVTFGCDIDDLTRVTSGMFDVGDVIYVSAFDNGTSVAENVSYSYNGSIFSGVSTSISFDEDV